MPLEWTHREEYLPNELLVIIAFHFKKISYLFTCAVHFVRREKKWTFCMYTKWCLVKNNGFFCILCWIFFFCFLLLFWFYTAAAIHFLTRYLFSFLCCLFTALQQTSCSNIFLFVSYSIGTINDSLRIYVYVQGQGLLTIHYCYFIVKFFPSISSFVVVYKLLIFFAVFISISWCVHVQYIFQSFHICFMLYKYEYVCLC